MNLEARVLAPVGRLYDALTDPARRARTMPVVVIIAPGEAPSR